jgi:DeoR family transcriptional regulator, aga operon transcriptional repressor
MNRYERLNAILELVAERSQIDVETLAEELDVSTATIRRDLDHLAQQQFLTRTRGGAVAHSVAYDLPLRYKTARLVSEKQRIGKAAADLVTAGMVIGINGGAIATRSDLRAPSGGRRSVTIVTNAVNIANELTVRPHVKIVVTGGVARPQSYELAGPLATHILEGVSLDMAILGADGVCPEHGASAHHEGEAMINQLMAARSRQVVVVADSSKIGAQAFARIRRTEEIDLLITDFGGPEESIRLFEEAGVKVMRV